MLTFLNPFTSFKDQPAIGIKLDHLPSVSPAAKHGFRSAMKMDNTLGAQNKPRTFLRLSLKVMISDVQVVL